MVAVERCIARKEIAQRNHTGLALRAFLRIERHRFLTGISWYEAKTSIIRDAVRAYLAKPIYIFKSNCVSPNRDSDWNTSRDFFPRGASIKPNHVGNNLLQLDRIEFWTA